MKKRVYSIFLLFVLMLLISSCNGIQFSQVSIPETFSSESNSILVKVADVNGKTASDLVYNLKSKDNFLSKVNAASFVFPSISSNGLNRWIKIDLDKSVDLDKEVAKYKSLPDVEYAEINYKITLNNNSNLSLLKSPVIPNDPNFSSQWYLHNTGQFGLVGADIDAPEAWEISNGSSNVVIAVVDSGVDYNHYDLQGKIWQNNDLPNGIDDDHNGYVDDTMGWNFVGNNRDTYDDNGRGTQMAGIMGAASGDSSPRTASKIRLNVTGMPWVPGLNYLLINEIQVYDNNLVNVALGQAVSSSPASIPGHPASNLTDGNITSGNYWQVNFPDGSNHNKAWVEINLQSLTQLNKIVITSFGGLGPINYTIEYLNSTSKWNVLYDISSNLNQSDSVITYVLNNSGIAGVCWNCKIMPVKVTDSSGSTTSLNAGKGIAYAANESANIIDLGFFGEPYSQLEQDAINYASQTSIIVVPAGDNSLSSKVYPCAYSNVTCVSALDGFNKRNYQANYNTNKDKWIDISSYGINLLTLGPGDALVTVEGSRFSSAIVSGILGLVRSYHPTWTNNQVVGQVLSTADQINYSDSTTYLDNESILGSGRVNAFTALSLNSQKSLVFKNYTIIDTAGNNDGNLNPGETVTLKVRIRSNGGNWNNVNSVLSSPDGNVIITSPNYNGFNLGVMNTTVLTFNSIQLKNNASLYNNFVNFTLNVTNSSGYSMKIPFRVEVDNRIKSGWPVYVSSTETFKRPIVGDVNGDGYSEVVVATQNKLYVYNRFGVLLNGWPITFPTNYVSSDSIALSDLNKDGKLEIILPIQDNSNTISILVYKYDGTVLSGWPVTLPNAGFVYGLVIGDVNNDGNSEIFVNHALRSSGVPIGIISSFKNDGTPFSPFGTKETPEILFSELSIGDINNDNYLELFALDNVYGNLSVWNYTGQNVTGFPVQNIARIQWYPFAGFGRIVLADLNKDNRLDILTGAGNIAFVNNQGNLVWKNNLADYMYYYNTNSAVGDFNGDGFFEIASGAVETNEINFDGFVLRVYNKDGNLINSCWNNFNVDGASYYVYSADVDNDQKPEIILAGSAGYSSPNQILAYNEDCSLVPGFPINNYIGVYPSFVDIDKDGKLDLVSANSNSMIIYDLYTNYNKDANTWPMYMHDVQNTGNYEFCNCFTGYVCKPNGMCVPRSKPGPVPTIDPGNIKA